MSDIKIEITSANVLEPGDKVIIAFEQERTLEEAEAFQTYVTEHMPGVDFLVINGGQAIVEKNSGTEPSGYTVNVEIDLKDVEDADALQAKVAAAFLRGIAERGDRL